MAHIILDDPRLRSYADIGRKAFGPKSTPLTSALFCLELFALRSVSSLLITVGDSTDRKFSVVLVTLYADSLHSVAPSYSANTYKLWGLVVSVHLSNPSLIILTLCAQQTDTYCISSPFTSLIRFNDRHNLHLIDHRCHLHRWFLEEGKPRQSLESC